MNAVIYCRVSSRDQVEGTSLESQERSCREYARTHNLTISRVFIEEGESAKFADRPQLLELLSYCKDKNRKIETLIVWKIDRFARNVEDHYAIKAALRKLGVGIVSVTEPIQADPNGKLMETILAGFAQFDNDIRAIRTVQGMQQRLREGIWPWKPPLGYLPPKIGKKTQPDQPDPRCFESIQKAWEFFATGAYRKADILRMLRTWGVRGCRGRLVSAQIIDDMFANPFYAGVLRDPWGGTEYTGRHVPMVSPEEYARVQDIVAGRSNAEPHHRLNDDFPLRGLVRCPSCKQLMTGYFARGRHRQYPYYKCFRRDCPTRTKSYAAALVHDEFRRLLSELSVPHSAAASVVSEIVCARLERTEQTRQASARRTQEVRRLKDQVQELISIRAARLISDDDFTVQQERLRRQLFKAQATEFEDDGAPLTAADVNDLTGALTDLNVTWQVVPVSAKRGFGELVLPAGFVFQQVRTAEKGLLFSTCGPSDAHLSTVVALSRKNVNTILAEIHRFLAIIRHGKEARKDAA